MLMLAGIALACLTEALALCAKLPSGYQRDLQLLKFPLFRGIDIAAHVLRARADQPTGQRRLSKRIAQRRRAVSSTPR